MRKRKRILLEVVEFEHLRIFASAVPFGSGADIRDGAGRGVMTGAEAKADMADAGGSGGSGLIWFGLAASNGRTGRKEEHSNDEKEGEGEAWDERGNVYHDEDEDVYEDVYEHEDEHEDVDVDEDVYGGRGRG